MEKDTLKYYENHLAKLILFASCIGIKIYWKPFDENAEWVPAKNQINIDNNLSQTDEIATLLHELGHAVADLFDLSIQNHDAIWRAYAKVYYSKHPPTTKQLALVLATEQNAWDLGRKIAKILKIRLGKWYTDIEKSAIKDYEES